MAKEEQLSMRPTVTGTDPDPYQGRQREWIADSGDNDLPEFEFLTEIRESMEAVDDRMVDNLQERTCLVLSATLHKADLGEVQAPERQTINIARAVARAKTRYPDNKGLHRLVEALWTVMVTESVALQAEAFEKTQPFNIGQI